MGGAVGMVNWASGYSRKPSTTGSEICRMSKEPNICHVELMVLENVKERLMMVASKMIVLLLFVRNLTRRVNKVFCLSLRQVNSVPRD